MNHELTVESLVAVIRNYHGIPKSVPIYESTLLEDDLGITGDDGVDLLENVQKEFGLSFEKTSFGLAEGEYLFHGEGFDILGLFAGLFGKKSETVRPFTVEQLFEAARKARKTPNQAL